MDKLKLEHLAGYLPYGLKLSCNTTYKVYDLIGLNKSEAFILEPYNCGWYCVSNFKPILRPLSDLIEVIQYDGYSVVPIARLLDIAISMNWSSTSYLSFDHGKNEYWTYFKGNKPSSIFGYNSEHKYFYLHDNNGNKESVKNHKELFDFLHELHFDIYGLIEKGLAIDIKTLNK